MFLFFSNILNVQHRIEWVPLDRLKKKHYNATRPRHRIFCAKLPDGHLTFECSVLPSKVDFYFKFDSPSGKQSSSGATLTSKVFLFLLWRSMVPKNNLVTNFLQNIFLCVRQNKDIRLELLEDEKMMTAFSFLGELSL